MLTPRYVTAFCYDFLGLVKVRVTSFQRMIRLPDRQDDHSDMTEKVETLKRVKSHNMKKDGGFQETAPMVEHDRSDMIGRLK
jgi:hypothetical protein